ncbi:ylmG homolog protein 1-1, chloroplastic-like [Glycine soja]|uniref:YlmG-like protein 1-2, chloroplastic n=1 Tax=Glycine soja TaxID=3848 RepID=A0A445JIG9_GLYSO|nr:ylmG homolog protein 1-1, chloroplastic-like [Glycine soja]RZB98266.1 YlmG-like protein 1-2, chloroplastic [Glycine soja]
MTMALLAGQSSISALPFVNPTSLSFKPLAFTKSLALPSAQRPTSLRLKCKMESDGDILRGSTRTVTTLMGLAVLLMKKAAFPVLNININSSSNSVSTMGALFLASLRDRPSASGALNTPLTVVAAGLGKWLDIYSGVLMVRVLLSWFPNIPWERQPLSAIRDLCDPYLNLFRNIIPPVFDTLDVSPLLAFAVLGTLGSILQTAM